MVALSSRTAHAGSSPHDWASPEYVRFWAARTDRYEDERRHRFELMADLIPFPADAPLAILDLGTGYGALTAVLLERFPAARATCVDGSAAMLALLEVRRQSLSGRITTVQADYSRPDWADALAGARFDAVVTSQGLHGQRTRRRALYREIFDLVQPGGCFLNVDLVPAGSLATRERFRAIQIRRRLRRYERAGAPRPTEEEVAAEVDGLAPGQAPAARPRDSWASGDWTEDLRWLRDAGFENVECFWKDLGIALLGGYRPRPAAEE